MNNVKTSNSLEKQAQSHLSAPSITLPKGGGAIQGIGEKFQTNPVTGTAAITIPIIITPSRADMHPKLSLSYNSGNGNGIFGLGWELSLPSITRKTEKALPTYNDDADEADADTFLLAGSEDLVPEFQEETFPDYPGYSIRRYYPRLEGLFARIERWKSASGDVHWQVITKDNITHIYGKTAQARIADPDYSQKIYQWLLEETFDNKGNVILYNYIVETDAWIDTTKLSEQRRSRVANRYLKHIWYGNQRPFNKDLKQCLFEVTFDYGDHHPTYPAPGDNNPLIARQDAFSQFRAGFEVRTHRLCRRVLMFHHFTELGASPCLVGSTDFTYAENPKATLLVSVNHTHYVKNNNSYLAKSAPPLTFAYSEARLTTQLESIASADLLHAPQGLNGNNIRWLDLYGEGLAGILVEQNNAWLYKHNLGEGKFSPAVLIKEKPDTASLTTTELTDVTANKRTDIVHYDQPLTGYYAQAATGAWQTFLPFAAIPNIDWQNPNLRWIDLNGDGQADILMTEDEVFVWYAAKGQQGFAPAEKVLQLQDEKINPTLIFADPEQSIFLADMSGDGLTDIVRIRNNEVSYWPNRGYGQFGKKITMDDAPHFDHPDLFDHSRIRLADIDGTGTTDIIYFSNDEIRIWFNQSGNSWAAQQTITIFPKINALTSASVIDLLGDGTACLVWSSSLPDAQPTAIRYLKLMNKKPLLLTSVNNNRGSETRIEYLPSTFYYLQDLQSSHPWLTKLPFPVHVVAKVTNYDWISKSRLVTNYRYHHGYYDCDEREFRGFGMVEKEDAEVFIAWEENYEDISFHQPPILTKSWFHNGAYNNKAISKQYAQEYYAKDEEATVLPESVLPKNLTNNEIREVFRALKGQLLRQEIYTKDGTSNEQHPYQVTEYNFQVEKLQSQQNKKHAVFYSHPSETITYHYERHYQKLNAEQEKYQCDPRVIHQFILEVTSYGNVTKTLSVAYPRREPLFDEQRQTLITYQENEFTNAIDRANAYPEQRRDRAIDISGAYRSPTLCESRQYEVNGLAAKRGQCFSVADVLTHLNNVTEVPFEETVTSAQKVKRLIQCERHLYYNDDLSAALPLGSIGALGLAHETYRLALTPGLITKVYNQDESRIDSSNLQEGGYLPGNRVALFNDSLDTRWWMRSGRHVFAATQFYLPIEFHDPFATITRLRYDTYDLHLIAVTDPLLNFVTAEYDYRVMQAKKLMDANGNRSEVFFNVLGLVTALVLQGKADQHEGDSPDGVNADSDDEIARLFFINPQQYADQLLGNATARFIYDDHQFYKTQSNVNDDEKSGLPNFSCTITREKHVADLAPEESSPLQLVFNYVDGFGRVIQTKQHAETIFIANEPHEWLGSGWTIFNNKAKPVRQYEPFFSPTHLFQFQVIVGVSSTLCYDPLDRVVAKLYPNKTYEKTVFNPWQQSNYDVNDMVLQEDPRLDNDVGYFFKRLPDREYLPTWYTQNYRSGDSSQQTNARKAAQHADTPTTSHFDVMGRVFLSVVDNGKDGEGNKPNYRTHTILDIQGNALVIYDHWRRAVMQLQYDMLGNKVTSDSLDAGKHWNFYDVSGKPLVAWNSRNIIQRLRYDLLQRLTHQYVITNNQPQLAAYIIYRDSEPEAKAHNLIGKIYQQYDQAGVITNNHYDFKGNLVEQQRQLANHYQDTIDWSQLAEASAATSTLLAQSYLSQAEGDRFLLTTRYDALNRALHVRAPNNAVTKNIYNARGLLQQVAIKNPDSDNYQIIIKNITYDAKGQRLKIEYGNQTVSEYSYEDATYRLQQHKTTRTTDDAILQDLHYGYDPIGNINTIRDEAHQAIYFNNNIVKPDASYTYNPLYQLISAEGREHAGQSANPIPNHDDLGRLNQPHPNDGQTMRRYVEHYTYDVVGNITTVEHGIVNSEQQIQPVWTRQYHYELHNNVPINNRLQSTALENYQYDNHGNCTSMPHLPQLSWNYADQLSQTTLRNGDSVYYKYDASGQRVRKIKEHVSAGNVTFIEEYIYVSGYEVFRQRSGNALNIVLERTTVHVMDNNRRVALIETKTIDRDDSQNLATPFIRFQLDNHLGSAILELDIAGNIITYEEYYPYGCTSYQGVTNTIEVSAKRYRFTGKERDGDTGFYYHGARYYAPWLGRWISCDPAGLVDGVNLYNYARANPIKYTDTSGRSSKETLAVNQSNLIYESDHIHALNLGGDPISSANLSLLLKDENIRKSDNSFNYQPYGNQISLADAYLEGEKEYQKVIGEMLGGRSFSEVKEMDALWTRASESVKTKNYQNIRGKFMQLIATDDSAEAIELRKAFEHAKVDLSFNPKTKSLRLSLSDKSYLQNKQMVERYKGMSEKQLRVEVEKMKGAVKKGVPFLGVAANMASAKANAAEGNYFRASTDLLGIFIDPIDWGFGAMDMFMSVKNMLFPPVTYRETVINGLRARIPEHYGSSNNDEPLY